MRIARIKQTASRVALLALLATTAIAPATAATKAIKCWHNQDGVRECGHTVPPEYAQQGSDVKDQNGVTIGTTSRAKTQAEVDAERAVAKQKAEELQAEKARGARDHVLLDTFSSEDDMLLSRDGQIAHLDSQIHLTRTHIDKLQRNLDQTIERAAEAERKNEKPSKEIVDNIASVRDQITDNEKFIDTKHQEQKDILARFVDDINRFRELKGLPAGPIPDPVAPQAPAVVPSVKPKPAAGNAKKPAT